MARQQNVNFEQNGKVVKTSQIHSDGANAVVTTFDFSAGGVNIQLGECTVFLTDFEVENLRDWAKIARGE